MERKNFDGRDIPMKREINADLDEVPIVARSPSFQQPLSEAEELTREALEQRKVKRG